MTDTDYAKVATLLEALAAGYRTEVSEAWFLFYRYGLEGLSIADIEQAVGRASQRCKFMPSPAELRSLAGDLPVADRALRAWQAVVGALRTHGHSHGVDFLDSGVTNAAVRLIGGWQALCKLPSDELKWAAKSFAAAYETVVEHGVESEQRRPLEGAYDIQDTKRIAIGGAIEARPALDSLKPGNALPGANGSVSRDVRAYVAGLVEPDRRLPREKGDE